MLSNIWEDGIEFFIALIVGFFDKISVLSTYAFSPQLLLFNTYFGGAIGKVYKILLDLSIVIAVIIFISKLIIGIVNPRDKNYESPFMLVKGFIRYLIILWLVPTILSFTLSITNTVYWNTIEVIDPSNQSATMHLGGSMWSGLQNWLINNEESLAYEEPEEDEEEDEDTSDTSWWGRAKQFIGQKSAEILNNVNNSVGGVLINGITGNALQDAEDAINSWGEESYENWQRTRYSEGLLAKLVSFFLIFILFKEYFCFMIEMAERYVLVGVLTFCAPLAMAPLVSEDTKQITKKYFSMWIGQLLVLVFSVIFLTVFEYGIFHMARTISSPGIYIDGSGMAYGKNIGGTYVFLLVMIGFLKIGQKMDTFLNNVGLTVGQTGAGMSMLGGLMLSRITQSVGRASAGLAGKALGSMATPGSPLNSMLGAMGVNIASPDAVHDKAKSDVMGAIKEQYHTDDPSKSTSKPGEKYASGLDNKDASDCLGMMNKGDWKDIAEELKGAGYGMDGDLAKAYAENTLQANDAESDLCIPEKAEINSARFNSDGCGEIDYTEENGSKHHLSIGDISDESHPASGPDYQVITDANGDEHYVQDYGDASLAEDMAQTALPASYDDAARAAMPGFSDDDIDCTRDMFGIDDDGSMYRESDGTYTAVDKDGNDAATGIKAMGIADYEGESSDSVHFDNGSGRVVSGEIVKDRPMQEIEPAFTQDPQTGKWEKGTKFSFNEDFTANAAALSGATSDDVRRLLNSKSGVSLANGEGALKSENGGLCAYDRFGNKIAENLRTGSESDYKAVQTTGGKSVMGMQMANGQYIFGEKAEATETKKAGYGLKFNEDHFRRTGEKSYTYDHIDSAGNRKTDTLSYDQAKQLLKSNHDDIKAPAHVSEAYKATAQDPQSFARNLDSCIKQGHLPSGERFEKTARAMFGSQLDGYQFDRDNPRNGFSSDGNRMTVIARKVDANGNPVGKAYEKLEFVRGSDSGKGMRNYEKVTSATGETWCKGEAIQQRTQQSQQTNRTASNSEPSKKKRQTLWDYRNNAKENSEKSAKKNSRK